MTVTSASFLEARIAKWGAPTRNAAQFLDGRTPRVQDFVKFESSPDDVRVDVAEVLVRESLHQVGALMDSGDVTWFLLNFGRDLSGLSGDDYEPFSGRRGRPLRSAILLVANSISGGPLESASDADLIASGGATVGSLYLLAQLEFYLRVKSKYLTFDGEVKTPLPQDLVAALGWGRTRKRVNQVDDALVIYLYENEDPVAMRIRDLNPAIGLRDRLALMRNPLIHGPLAESLTEGMVYALVLAMCYYGDRRRRD